MSPTTEGQPVPVAPVVSTAVSGDKGKKICKVDQNESSSRLRKRVCMTQSEWDRADSGVDVNDLKSMGAH